jgi:UDP-N-acetylmuramyl pentapeptide phosphotransferase/UDP-N-acetylglucosamine-1-phosphate transferase
MPPHPVTIDNWPQILACLALGFFICWSLIGLILKQSAKLATARAKDFHHGHTSPIPRLGGVAIACAFVAVALAVALCTAVPPAGQGVLCVIVFTSLAMFVLGLWDDLRPLGAKFKLRFTSVTSVSSSSTIPLLAPTCSSAPLPMWPRCFGWSA